MRNFRSLLLSALVMIGGIALIAAPVTPIAAQTAPPTPTKPRPESPITRTAEDLAAIAALEAAIMQRQPRDLDSREDNPSHFEIPLTIKVGLTPYVHCSDWVNAGMPVDEVIEMDFKEYIRNVLPNEWVNSWHPQSLQTGAVAAKSFAWWRIMLVNPRPMGADVVDNTCDQVFFANSHRPTTDAAIDATWHYRMSRDNRIIEIHYLAHDWQCDNLGWEMCMGQWGTKDKSDAGWLWQDILHHYYDPVDINITSTIPPNVDLILNGGFDQGTERWLTWGGIEGAGVVDGVYRFHRKVGSANPAAVYQDLNYRVPKDTPMRVSLLLGNSSAVEKTIEVHLRHANTWDGAVSCTFTLLPNLPMQKYSVYASNASAWVGVRLEVQGKSDDGQPAYLMDKVKVLFSPKGKPNDVPACDAPRPGKPSILSPVAGATYGKDVPVLLAEGASNLRPGYSPAYQVQVSVVSDFSSILYDNDGNLSTSPSFPVRLSDGAYYLRVRQSDGIDRFSRWTKGVMFNVLVLPDTPQIIAPSGVASANGLAFQWAKSADTDEYKLSLRDAAGNKLASAKYTPAVCTGGTCSVPASALPVSFTIGQSYQWRMSAKNANGKAKSAWVAFTLVNATSTPAATLTPLATASATWTETPDATETLDSTATLTPTDHLPTETATATFEATATGTPSGTIPLP
jgi:hypothetical protein